MSAKRIEVHTDSTQHRVINPDGTTEFLISGMHSELAFIQTVRKAAAKLSKPGNDYYSDFREFQTGRIPS